MTTEKTTLQTPNLIRLFRRAEQYVGEQDIRFLPPLEPRSSLATDEAPLAVGTSTVCWRLPSPVGWVRFSLFTGPSETSSFWIPRLRPGLRPGRWCTSFRR